MFLSKLEYIDRESDDSDRHKWSESDYWYDFHKTNRILYELQSFHSERMIVI